MGLRTATPERKPALTQRLLSVAPAALVLLAFGIGVAGYEYYLQQKANIETAARDRLATISDLKVRQVVAWRRERFADAKMLAATGLMPAVRKVLGGRGGVEARDQAQAWIDAIRHAAGYANVILLDREGRLRLSVGRVEGNSRHFQSLANEVRRHGDIVFSDLHYDEGLHGPHLGLSIPLRAATTAPLEGFLLLGVDPNEFLFPLIQLWPTPSRTAETLLARREGDSVLFLNELRHRRGTALKLRIPLSNRQVPAARAVLGTEGLVDGVDYRGVRVLAALRKVPESPWVLVAKEDEEEVYEPIRRQVLWLALIGSSLALALVAGGALVWRNVRLRFYEQRYESELERKALIGHYDYLSRFANDIILLMSADARIVEANDRALSAYGYDRAELIGMPLKDLRAPSERETFDRQWRALEQEESLMFETMHRHRNGTSFPVEVSARRIVVENKVFIQSIIRDITERKHAEEERTRLQEQLLQAQKMESIGRLAGGVAHDFNNLLTVINGYAGLALAEVKADHPLAEQLAEIAQAGERAAGLTQQLLAFSRKQVIHPKVLDLNELVGDVSKMLGRLVGEHIEVVTRLAPEPARVLADHVQIQQVLMNLAANARDAMPPPRGGRFVIEVDTVELGEAYIASHTAIDPGAYVLLTVSDTGAGMDEETRKHAFEPFFTTKPKGEGTGLGLSSVYGIVKQSKGWIWVYAEPGQGTTFKIHLPRILEPGDSTDTGAVESSEALRGSETVLIVEDQEEVRQLAASVLAHYGYRVHEAADGAEALRLCQSLRESIQLMITDVVMPGMTGRELADRVAALQPAMKVLYISGYSADLIGRNGVLDAGIAYLPKPFTPVALARKVRAVLVDRA